MATTLHEIYDRLFSAFGPQDWWPGESAFEVMVGAILVQNTAWKNVEKAIDRLREEGLLTPEALWRVPQPELEELLRPAGYYRLKAGRLRNLLRFFMDRYDGSTEAMFATPPDVLREELLAVSGVGPETADSILLYAGSLPVFVVDTYTHRVLARHGWIGYDADYHAIQDHFESNLESDASLYNEYHALLVHVGHKYCRPAPKCDDCPLNDLLPKGGPLPPD